jgi:trimethylamine--corrinoid protein Co-methyltransferase
MFSVLKKVAQGVPVNEDTLASKVIANVVMGENYLDQQHTLKYLKSGEVFIPELGFKDLWNEWEQSGQEKINDNAHKYARQILQKDDFELLPSELVKEINIIVNAARSELVEKGN